MYKDCVYIKLMDVNHDHKVRIVFYIDAYSPVMTLSHTHTLLLPWTLENTLKWAYPLSACMRILHEYMNNKCSDMRA